MIKDLIITGSQDLKVKSNRIHEDMIEMNLNEVDQYLIEEDIDRAIERLAPNSNYIDADSYGGVFDNLLLAMVMGKWGSVLAGIKKVEKYEEKEKLGLQSATMQRKFLSFTDMLNSMRSVSFSIDDSLNWFGHVENESDAIVNLTKNAIYDHTTGNGGADTWGHVTLRKDGGLVLYTTTSGLLYGWSKDDDGYTAIISHKDRTKEEPGPKGSTLIKSCVDNGYKKIIQ